MKYLSIEYKIDNIQPEHIKAIEDILKPYEGKFLDKFLTTYPEYKINKLEVVLAPNIWNEIDLFYESKGRNYDLLRPKGLEHLVKTINLQGQTKYFWNANYFAEPTIEAFFRTVIGNLVNQRLSSQLSINYEINFHKGRDYISELLFKDWIVSKLSDRITTEIIGDEELSYETMEDFIFVFKRNIRKYHYDYQRTEEGYLLLSNCIRELQVLIRRIMTYKTSTNLSYLEEFESEIKTIVALVEEFADEVDKLSELNYDEITDLVTQILKKCDIIYFDLEHEIGADFRIDHGPKKLFPDLVDTHPRILCFLDILGFKALIEEYESDNSSIALKKLKRTFDNAKKGAIDVLIPILDKDFQTQMEFRLFSDCITISIPYIDFGIDLVNGFFNMSLMLNVFLQTFMREGFYLRGHVTIGSYYSDENMLFSGALVEAYQHESKTIYPIVSINSKIVDKVLSKDSTSVSHPAPGQLIIKYNGSNQTNAYFINPFYTYFAYQKSDDHFENIFKNLFGSDYPEEGLGLSFKSQLDEKLKESGIEAVGSEIDKEKLKIIEMLSEKYQAQLDIYNNLKNDHKKRSLASSVMEKYSFLFKLYDWLFDDKNNELFSFVNL